MNEFTNKKRKSLRGQVYRLDLFFSKEDNGPVVKRTKMTEQKETKGFTFLSPQKSKIPRLYNFIRLEEERKRLKMSNDVVNLKSENILPSSEQPKKKRFCSSRLNQLAKPKVRPRIKDHIQLPKKIHHKMKLESVLAPPPPLQKSTRPTTKVNSKPHYVLLSIDIFRLAHPFE